MRHGWPTIGTFENSLAKESSMPSVGLFSVPTDLDDGSS